MDDTLPSYGQATNRDHWSIIASFVRSADLCSAALVCREWNKIFSPLLWGNPASHFGKENDAVYVALVRFKRTLIWARSTTRELTHTLHFPPAQAEIYDGPRSEWLSDILHRLPRLQSLVISQLPFFDHGALSSLIRLSQPDPSRGLLGMAYSLRLLDASNCNNVTPQALAGALKLFPALVYLDLSETPSARYTEVLSSLEFTPALQILKLQRIWLNDDDLLVLIRAVGRNLRSLDLRSNRITDCGIRSLIQDCIRLGPTLTGGSRSPSRPSTKLQKILDSDSQDDFIRARLTTGFASYLGIEGTVGYGVTHLYVSGNEITIGGASGLLRCRQLRVLDIGEITTETVQTPPPRYELPPSRLSLPGPEKLIPVIESYAGKLTYLRINHAVVTEFQSFKDAKAFEMEDSSDMGLPENVAELDVIEQTVYELPNNPVHELEGNMPVYAELEGSPVQPSTAIDQARSPRIQINDVSADPKIALDPVSALSPTLDCTGGLFSPVSPLSSFEQPQIKHKGPTTNAHLLIPTEPSTIRVPEPGLEVNHRVNSESSSQPQQSHRRTYSGVLNEHEARLKYRQSQDHALLPGTLGQIRTLVLTDVPSRSRTPDTAQRLIDFIKGCAEEDRWAVLQASVGYQLPPGSDRRSAETQYARSLFPFRRLVLEMAPELQDMGPSGGWLCPTNPSQMLSSTLDPDCETYLNAAKDDFSFFGSEECGQPDTEGLAPIPIAAFKEKMTIDPSGHRNGNGMNGKSITVQQPVYDVLAEVSRFRKGKKAEHEAVIAAGITDHVEGYWNGTIEVVRPRR